MEVTWSKASNRLEGGATKRSVASKDFCARGVVIEVITHLPLYGALQWRPWHYCSLVDSMFGWCFVSCAHWLIHAKLTWTLLTDHFVHNECLRDQICILKFWILVKVTATCLNSYLSHSFNMSARTQTVSILYEYHREAAGSRWLIIRKTCTRAAVRDLESVVSSENIQWSSWRVK